MGYAPVSPNTSREALKNTTFISFRKIVREDRDVKQIWFKDLQVFCTITFKGDLAYLESQHNVGVTAIAKRGNCSQRHVPQINCSSSNTYFVVLLYTNLALNLITTNSILAPVYPKKPTRNIFISIHYLSLSCFGTVHSGKPAYLCRIFTFLFGRKVVSFPF